MSAQIIKWPYPTKIDLPAAKVLDEAAKEDFESVFVCGFLKNGDEFFAASSADGGTIMWLMERAKHLMMQHADQ